MTDDFTHLPKSSDSSDGFLVNINFQRAITIRMKLKDYLKEHNVDVRKYLMVVDHNIHKGELQYGLRVIGGSNDRKDKVVLELWDPTPVGLMSDRNLALLLILYQS